MGPKLKSAVFKAPPVHPKRRRTKRLHRELLEQLEFYFSEANFRHDAFMREKTGENGMNDVPIQLLLTFPLIQEVKATEKNVINAVENSMVLELSQDRTQLHRRYPITTPPHNLEESTLYIENLPPDSTTGWLKDVCQKLGTVRHISLPRYKKSGQIKGFAFVEYSSPEDVARACCIFRDPPKNFFPSRTEKYMKHLKRVQHQQFQKLPATPIYTQHESKLCTPSSNSSLNKSIDSAIEFEELLQEKPGEVSPVGEKSRKRKRSQRLSDVSSHSLEENDTVSNHRAAKKRKSVPINVNLNGEDISKVCETTPQTTVSMTTKKKQGRKVNFSVDENFISSYEKTSENNVFDKDNDHIKCMPDDVKIEILKTGNKCKANKKNPNEEHICPIKHSIIESAIENTNTAEDVQSKTGIKRRRSVSEPPGLVDEDGSDAKRLKDDGNQDIIHQPMYQTALQGDINELISIGRMQAQKIEEEVVVNDSPKIPALQSVIAKPMSQPKKSCEHSRKSRERRKINAGRVPPNLTVMPKTHWTALKKEYKRLQKLNMSRLKMTIRENKDAGSVFIKKHLDVLRDVRITNEAVNSDVNYGMTDQQEPIKEHSLMKRGPPTFQPGVIVKISVAGVSTSPPSGDDTVLKLPGIEEIKTLLNKYGQGVAYVDLKPGDVTGYVRFNDGESAQRAIMEEKSLALCLLTGEMEEKYWDKLLASRARKFSKERPKIRGRTKILSRAEMLVEKGKRRHIRFDSDFMSL